MTTPTEPRGENGPPVATAGEATSGASPAVTAAASATSALAMPTEAEIVGLESGDRGTYATVTEKILSDSKLADLGEISTKLTELVAVSKGFSPSAAKHGLLGKAVGLFRDEREQVLSHVQTVQHRVDAIITELDGLADRQRARMQDMAALKRENETYVQHLQANAVRAEAWLRDIEAKQAAPSDPSDPTAAAKKLAIDHTAQRLRVAIDDIKNAATLARQQALEIETTENNGSAILEEFVKTKTLVIPALQSVLAQYLVGLEQKKAASADTMLRDTLADAMKQAAQMTGDNAVQIATLQQTSMIKLQTIEECQTMLEASAAKIQEIDAAGREQRAKNAAERAKLEQRMLDAPQH